MVIGLGDEKDLSLDALRVVGRVAGREAVRLKARHVAWAPVIRDEGNTAIDVGEGRPRLCRTNADSLRHRKASAIARACPEVQHRICRD